jgi:alpha-galactosidase
VSYYAFPGGWNDMDMLLVGNYGNGKATSAKGMFKGLSDMEYESHMALWCLFNSPLLASCDLRTMNEATKKILLNEKLLNINQDILGKAPSLISNKNGVRIYKRVLANNEVVVAILNYSEKEKAINIPKKDDAAIFENLLTGEKITQAELSNMKLKPHQIILLSPNGK